MRVVYIGHYDTGSTSGMRGEYLRQILNPSEYCVVNIDLPLKKTSKVFRSIGWRYRIGPLISNINDWINVSLPAGELDLVWIDKGVFIKPSVLHELRSRCKTLVHFTPDPAFRYHRSSLFYEGLPDYDHCITTKSYELDEYKKYGAKNILYCTQGYDPLIHKPSVPFAEKSGLAFIGHMEADRLEIISRLLEKKVTIKLAGINWESFARKHRGNNYLQYTSGGIFGENYARTISGSLLGLGFLSRIVPELHTTRTFEIPACGTALVTERNDETNHLFNDDEAIFFSNPDELLERVTHALAHLDELKQITEKGSQRITGGGYDYKSILQRLISEMQIPVNANKTEAAGWA